MSPNFRAKSGHYLVAGTILFVLAFNNNYSE